MAPGDWVGMAATCLVAALLLAANGFGFALLAVPGLLLFAPPAQAVQLVIIVSVAVLLVILPGLRDAVDVRLLARLGLGALCGVPLGVLAFRWADPEAVRAVIGAVVLAFAVVLALRRRGRWGVTMTMRPTRDLAAGAAAGAATALAGISGPPVVIYLMLAEMPVRTLRATLLAFFMLCYAGTLLAELVTIGVPGAAWRLAAGLVPFAWVGGFFGRRLGDRLGAETAGNLALAVLTAAGIYTLAGALWQAVRG
jgi:uncharacterized protein